MFLVTVVIFPLSALDVSQVDVFGGLYWQGNSDPEGAPSPLKPVWGVEVPITLTSLISINPSLSFPSPFDYTLTTAGLAVPTEIETADAVTVLQLVLDPKLAFNFVIKDIVVLSPFFSPAFTFFIPTFGYGKGKVGYTDPVTEEAGTFRSDLVTSLYSFFRIFRPSIGVNADWIFSNTFGLYGSLAAYFPLFNIWDDLTLPFYEGFIVTFRIGLSIHFDGTSVK